uniref:Uncharacterized protein n=1 Tax=Rhinopithecus bieti TaxID=61621 RepID=A0A2K6KYY4_RHIBE
MACICFCHAEASVGTGCGGICASTSDSHAPWRPGAPGSSPNTDSCRTCAARVHLGPVTQPEQAEAVPLSRPPACAGSLPPWPGCLDLGF